MSQKSTDNYLTDTSAAHSYHGRYPVLLYVCYTYVFFTYQTSENMLNKEN